MVENRLSKKGSLPPPLTWASVGGFKTVSHFNGERVTLWEPTSATTIGSNRTLTPHDRSSN